MNRGNYFSCLTDFSTLALRVFLLFLFCLLLSACGGRGDGIHSFETGRSFDGEKLFTLADNREEMQGVSNALFLAGEADSLADASPVEPGADEIINREDAMLSSAVILFDQDALPDDGIYEVDDTLPEDGSLRLGVIVSGNTHSLFAGQMDLPGEFERINVASIEIFKSFYGWGEHNYAGNGLFSVQASENVLTHRGGVEMTFDFADNQMTSFIFTNRASETVQLINIDMMESGENGYSGVKDFETTGDSFSDLDGRFATVNTEFFGDVGNTNPPAGAITTVEGNGFSGAFALRGAEAP